MNKYAPHPPEKCFALSFQLKVNSDFVMGFAIRKPPWQCGLPAASDENLHYSISATS